MSNKYFIAACIATAALITFLVPSSGSIKSFFSTPTPSPATTHNTSIDPDDDMDDDDVEKIIADNPAPATRSVPETTTPSSSEQAPEEPAAQETLEQDAATPIKTGIDTLIGTVPGAITDLANLIRYSKKGTDAVEKDLVQYASQLPPKKLLNYQNDPDIEHNIKEILINNPVCKKMAKLAHKCQKQTLIVGKSGTGKTRLLKTIEQECKEGNIPVYLLSASAGEDAIIKQINAALQQVSTPEQYAQNNAINLQYYQDQLYQYEQNKSYYEQMAQENPGNQFFQKPTPPQSFLTYNPFGKAVILIDDLEAFSGKPSFLLQQALDGLFSDDRCLIIAAARSADGLDPALIRSGRFDENHTIELTTPNAMERLNFLMQYCNKENITLDVDVQLTKVVELADNFTTADLVALAQNAQKLARKSSNKTVHHKQFLQAVAIVLKNNARVDKNLDIRVKAILAMLNAKKQEKNGFARLAGEVPAEITELVDQLRDSTPYKKFNLAVPKGILLAGPPGTGKTTLVRALSEEAGCDFMSFSGSEFVVSLVGEGAQKIRDAFIEARKRAANSKSGKTVIFFDELDAIGKRQGNTLDATITELLTQMDGFSEDESVIVIAATNHPENLDPALLRPGRFSKTIVIDLPDAAKRMQLLELYTKGIPLASDVDLKKVVRATDNYSPADLKETMQKAGTLALREKSSHITEAHIIEALKQTLRGRILKGESDIPQKLEALDVIFNGAASNKGFNSLVGPIEQDIVDIVEMLQGKLDHEKYGLTPPKGVLLVGPPGTGKTAVARAIAEESGCEFIQAKGSQFIEKFVGVGAQRVRELFAKARDKARCSQSGKAIIFIDEIDAIGNRDNDHSGEATQTLTELLTQLDGFYKDESVIVFAATNKPKSLDAALIRAGRFDTVVKIDLPNAEKRRNLFTFYTKKRPVDSTVDYAQLAADTEGFNAADIKNIVDKAAQNAMREKAQSISQAHFDTALADAKAARNQKSQSFISK